MVASFGNNGTDTLVATRRNLLYHSSFMGRSVEIYLNSGLINHGFHWPMSRVFVLELDFDNLQSRIPTPSMRRYSVARVLHPTSDATAYQAAQIVHTSEVDVLQQMWGCE